MSSADLGGQFSGYSRQELIDQLRNEAQVEVPENITNSDLVKLARKVYRRSVDIPLPPALRTSNSPIKKVDSEQVVLRRKNKKPVIIPPRKKPTNADERALAELEQRKKKKRYSGGFDLEGNFNAARAQEEAARFAFSLREPDVQAAKDYKRRFHPSDADGQEFPLFSSSAGRFCLSDSSWFDLFNEGIDSDFARFGVGISLYF